MLGRTPSERAHRAELIVRRADQSRSLNLAQQQNLLITVDLAAQAVSAGNDRVAFEIEPMRHTALLEGLDEIGLTLQHAAVIAGYQAADRVARPWVWLPRE